MVWQHIAMVIIIIGLFAVAMSVFFPLQTSNVDLSTLPTEMMRDVQTIISNISFFQPTTGLREYVDYEKLAGKYFLVDNLEIAFKSECPPGLVGGKCWGYTGAISQIKIVTNEQYNFDVYQLNQVCNHEVCHTKYSLSNEVEERICSEEETDVQYEICTKLVEMLRENGYVYKK